MKYYRDLIVEYNDKVKAIGYRIQIGEIEVQALHFEQVRLLDKIAEFNDRLKDLEVFNKQVKEGRSNE
jgi:hypothetical protein